MLEQSDASDGECRLRPTRLPRSLTFPRNDGDGHCEHSEAIS